MNFSPCDNCRYRQKNLDPYGCFHRESKTGILGRIIRLFFGCWRYGGVEEYG